MDIAIRNIDINADIQGIRKVHAADDHWGSDEKCFFTQKTCLETGFFIQVATLDEKIVGHAEWIISNEPAHRFLYLGILQIHNDYQKKGIGTKMLESGAAYAKENDCIFIRTMPEIKTGSVQFYEKNGFAKIEDSNRILTIKTLHSPDATKATHIDQVPFDIVKTLPLVMGLYQHSSAHIWHVFNKYRTTLSFKIGDAYVNINEFDPADKSSEVACWSNRFSPTLIAEILGTGYNLGYKYLDFCVLSKNVPCFDSFEYEMSSEHDIFMERCLHE